jgi:serine/threonine-protein kinase
MGGASLTDDKGYQNAEGARYRVVTPLGAGGTANVFLALAERPGGLRKLVVLKTLLSHLAEDLPLVDMFRHEARLAARLKHPNVVEVYEVIEDGSRPVLVMEFLRGASLRELVRGSREGSIGLPDLQNRIDIVRQTCLGLHYCHELLDFDGSPLNIVHRDVSPHNIYVTLDGGVRLLDFGIAKISGIDTGTQTGFIKGKLRYMAPEQMTGETIDRRADIYAIGVVLWESIAGREMWDGVSDPVVLNRTVNGKLPALEDENAQCPPALLSVVKRCLAINPADRYQTAEEVADALEAVLSELPAPATRLAKYVTARFGARDEETNAQVRQMLADKERTKAFVESDHPIDWGQVTSSRYGAIPPTLVNSSRTRHRPPPSRRWIAWAAIPMVSLAAGLSVAAVGFARPSEPLQSIQKFGPALRQPVLPALDKAPVVPVPVVVAAAVEPAPAPAPAPARIRIEANPRFATLSLDGQPLATNPADITIPNDDAMHEVTATARGYDNAVSSFRTMDGAIITLTLKRQVTGKPSASRPASEPEAAASEPQPSKEPSSACGPGYVVSKSGLIGARSGDPACAKKSLLAK